MANVEVVKKSNFNFDTWVVLGKKSHILQSRCTQPLQCGPSDKENSPIYSTSLCDFCLYEKELELPQLPEMTFASNCIRLEHDKGFGIEFNALDALKLVDSKNDVMKVAIAEAWQESSCGTLEKEKFQMAFLEKAKKQDLVLLAEELGQKVSDKMTVIDLKNIIIGSKDYEEEFVRAQLSVISEERVERETEEKIARQHAIQLLRWESELNELRLEIESIRSNVKRTSCAEDRKKTSSNYRISIGRAEEHVRETSPAVLMAEAMIPVTTPIKEEKGMGTI
ncbi:TIP41-like protein [Trichonephila clavipes]|nr:TIP41-like protein [Trichonephila clavipes]